MQELKRKSVVFTGAREHPARLEVAFPLDPGDSVGKAVAFCLVGLSAPEPMLLSTSRSTSSGAKFERPYESGHRWGVEHRTSFGRDNSRERPLRSTHKLTHPQSDVAVNHTTQNCMRVWDGQHTVVAGGVSTQAHDCHRKLFAKRIDPCQTGEIVGDPGRDTHRQNRNDRTSQEVETVGDHKGVPDGPVHAGPKPRRQRNRRTEAGTRRWLSH